MQFEEGGASVSETKVPVAMRLPRHEVELVEDYAAQRGVSKTDAFLHFLRRGIEAEQGSAATARMQASLDEILDILRASQGGSLAMADRPRIVEAVVREAERFPAVRQAILFGSFARGDARPESDIDLRLILDDGAPFSLYDLAQFKKAVERACGRDADVVTAKTLANPNLAAAIEREGVVIYDREEG